jgi:hypothetical protein
MPRLGRRLDGIARLCCPTNPGSSKHDSGVVHKVSWRKTMSQSEMWARACGSFLIFATELTFHDVAVTFNVPTQPVTTPNNIAHARAPNI